MELHRPRKLKFKAWNAESKLLMRLNSIDCIKGELHKKQHVLLQFTELFDKQGEEIYDMDVLLSDNKKYLVKWDDSNFGWTIVSLEEGTPQTDIKGFAEKAFRLRSYFEAGS